MKTGMLAGEACAKAVPRGALSFGFFEHVAIDRTFARVRCMHAMRACAHNSATVTLRHRYLPIVTNYRQSHHHYQDSEDTATHGAARTKKSGNRRDSSDAPES